MSEKMKKLTDLKNVGKATMLDLQAIGIDSVDALADCDPTELFQLLEKTTGERHDLCVWDVFAAIIHEAKTGEPAAWWDWTPVRKSLQNRVEIHYISE